MAAQISFLMHIKRYECQCGNAWETSDLFQITVVGETRRLDTFTDRPTVGHDFGISNLPLRRVHVCFDCASAFDAQRKRGILNSLASWEDTLRRKAQEEGKGQSYIRIRFTSKPPTPKVYAPSAEEL